MKIELVLEEIGLINGGECDCSCKMHPFVGKVADAEACARTCVIMKDEMTQCFDMSIKF